MMTEKDYIHSIFKRLDVAACHENDAVIEELLMKQREVCAEALVNHIGMYGATLVQQAAVVIRNARLEKEDE